MKNKLVITRTTLFIISFLISYNISSQTTSPFNSPPVNFSGNYSSGTQNNAAGNAVLNTVNVSNAANYTIKARNYISIQSGNSAANFSGGSFAAYIEESPIEVVSYHPNGFSNIPLYDKFELGIKLPLDITQKVDDFFGKYKITNDHPGYGCEFNTGSNFINPYDPEQISVEATFSFPGEPDQKIFGFYYRDYSYSNPTLPINYINTDWVEDLNLKYHWRVRFAPKYIGTYNVAWVIRGANNAILYQDNIGQRFSTITSSSEGFIKLGANNKFFVTQPSFQPEKTILPIGVMFSHPRVALRTGEDALPASETPEWGSGELHYPSRYWLHREKIKTQIAQKGGNFVRLMSAPYSYDIEWEHAGIYDARKTRPIQNGLTVSQALQNIPGIQFINNAWPPTFYKGTNRQAILWEFDKLLDMAKDNNLYIQWVTDMMDNAFTAGDSNSPWAIENPYAKPGSNIISPPIVVGSVEQFFTDINAKEAYKKKLRYIIARYGYSTNIADFELFNEFHNLNCQMGGGTKLNDVFKPWLEYMLEYIKGTSGLNHKDHLFTVSYEKTGGSCGPPPNTVVSSGGDNVGSLTNLDFFSTHPYNYNANTFWEAFDHTKEFRTMYTSSNGKPKPCQAGELALQPAWGCINKDMSMFPEFMTPTFHTLLWSTTFIGGLTSGIAMWDGGLEIDPSAPTNHPCGDGYIQHFKPIQAFIKDIPFDQDNYVPKYVLENNLETFYLVNKNGVFGDYAAGYIRNNTFWWENFTNPNSGSLYYSPTLKNEYENLFTNTPSYQNCPVPNLASINFNLNPADPVLTIPNGAISIDGFDGNKWYKIEWYNTYIDPAVGNPLITTQTMVNASPSGHIVLFPPPFSGCQEQEYAYKIWPMQFSKPAVINTNSYEILKQIKNESGIENVNINVYPNPASDKVCIKYNKEKFKNSTIELTDMSGRLILKQVNADELTVANIENGAYLIRFMSENYVKTFKINVMH